MDARTDPLEPVRSVIEQAAAWQTQLADPECPDSDRTAFADWLAADPTHRTAFERMAAIADHAQRQGPIERTALKSLALRRRRPAGTAIASLLALALVGRWISDMPDLRSRIADRRSAVGEISTAKMAGGDRITLDSNSAADIDEHARSVRLWRGRLLASVLHGRSEPFVVRTAQGTARALGTRFSVAIDGDSTIVRVLQSKVEVCAAAAGHPCLMIAPGQGARLDAAGVERLASFDPAAESAWSEGLLVADDRPLADVLAELARYRSKPLRYDPADLAGLSVTGTFPLTDTDRALASIAAALPVTISPETDAARISRR